MNLKIKINDGDNFDKEYATEKEGESINEWNK